MGVHVYNPGTQEVGGGRHALSSHQAKDGEFPARRELHREPCLKEKKDESETTYLKAALLSIVWLHLDDDRSTPREFLNKPADLCLEIPRNVRKVVTTF